jgi:hypothetical protein
MVTLLLRFRILERGQSQFVYICVNYIVVILLDLSHAPVEKGVFTTLIHQMRNQ